MSPSLPRTREWSDLDFDFLQHPISKDVRRKLNDDSLKQSVKSLLMTNFYERKFHPEIGSGIRASLFENMSPFTAISLHDAIVNVLQNYEPRVKIAQISVIPDFDRNGYRVELAWYSVNDDGVTKINLFLERLR